MKPDIANKDDIQSLVNFFYDKVKTDTTIGFFFTNVITIDWDKHIPLMCSFWENVLFYTGEYAGNPMKTHRKIHQQYQTAPAHFERWIALWNESVDMHFKGPNATKVKKHALAIATVMLKNI